jgi:hypothetical protein
LETIKNSGGGGGDGEEEEEEEGIPVITDMDFNEQVIVSLSGYLLPTHRPWNLFILLLCQVCDTSALLCNSYELRITPMLCASALWLRGDE